jgi:hypothetical protein
MPNMLVLKVKNAHEWKAYVTALKCIGVRNINNPTLTVEQLFDKFYPRYDTYIIVNLIDDPYLSLASNTYHPEYMPTTLGKAIDTIIEYMNEPLPIKIKLNDSYTADVSTQIVRYENSDNLFTIDIGRPDIFNDKDREWWRVLHTWIKESTIHIGVSPAFWFVDNIINEGKCYGGGGFKYMFWFESQLEANYFKEVVDELVQKERETVC